MNARSALLVVVSALAFGAAGGAIMAGRWTDWATAWVGIFLGFGLCMFADALDRRNRR